MAEIAVGTASWTDPSLIKSARFYPKGCSSAEGRLRFYASLFKLVEIDSSYYAMPSAQNATKWAERTPDDFRFNCKAFRLFTGHQTPAAALPADVRAELASHFASKRNLYYKDTPLEIRDHLWERFLAGVRPLVDAGKLGALHFQFAPWMTAGAAGRQHIEECRRRTEGFEFAAEFRHCSWFAGGAAELTLAMERELDIANVVVDEPQGFANSIPAIWEVTTPARAVVRLHGRNTATWNDKEAQAASDRFNYDYSDDELRDLASSIQTLAADRVDVVFNNNYEDQGQRNARTLMQILDALPGPR